MTIAIVAVFQITQNGFLSKPMLFISLRIRSDAFRICGLTIMGSWNRKHLPVASIASNLWRSVEEYLHLGVGEDGRANVASFHHHASTSSQRPLLRDHPRP